MIRSARFVVCFVCISSIAHSQQNETVPSQKIERIDSFLKVIVDNNLFNGTVLVAQNGKVIYQRSAGYFNFEKKIPNSTTVAFNLASTSKPFTSLAILQLQQAGKLHLEDVVSKYLPDFPFQSITIKHLLTHTSGLPRIEDVEDDYVKKNPDKVISASQAYKDLAGSKDTLSFHPGDKFQYSNTNYFILSLIIEKASGLSFADYMKKRIFDPVGMKHSYIRQATQANTPRYILPAMFCTEFKNVDSVDKNNFYTYYQLGALTGANNVISTMEDLLLFDNALNAGKLIDPKLLDEAWLPAVLNNGKKTSLGGARTYGMGWNVMDEPGKDRVIFHDGNIPGLTVMFYKNLTKNQTIFYYDNRATPFFFAKMGNVARILNDQPLNKIPLRRSAVRVFGQTLINKGFSEASLRLDELRKDSAVYYIDELEMNTLGYDLLFHGLKPEHKALAVEVFKLNTELYPTHANVYDSYAEALALNGRKEEAIEMYKKTLQMNPDNDSAKKALEQLMK